MNISGKLKFAVVIAVLGILASPAAAAVEVLEAQANLEHWVLYAGNFSPCAGASWSHDPEEGVTFDLQSPTYDDVCVVSSWLGQCDASGFLFNGEISPVTEGSQGWSVYLQSQISVRLDVTAPTWLSADRSAEGSFPAALHTVVLVFPDGSTEVLLGEDSGVDSAERLLGEGIYRVTFSIERDDWLNIPFSYSGQVSVSWDDPVGQKALTLDGIKSMYRAEQ